MAKAFLVRWGTQNDFDSIKLQIRELGFTIDNERLYVGGNDKNIHIPSEEYVSSMISEKLEEETLLSGTTIELQTKQLPGILAFDKDKRKISYNTPDGGGILYLANEASLPLRKPVSVSVATENIDADDSNSVSIAGFTRPVEIIFRNGQLCTDLPSDTNRYSIDRASNILKVYNCADGDVISYL